MRVWISMGIHEGGLKPAIAELSGVPASELVSQQDGGPTRKLVRTPKNHWFMGMKCDREKEAWLIFRES